MSRLVSSRQNVVPTHLTKYVGLTISLFKPKTHLKKQKMAQKANICHFSFNNGQLELKNFIVLPYFSISRPRRDGKRCLVPSRLEILKVLESLVLSRIQISENSKVLSCLECIFSVLICLECTMYFSSHCLDLS